MGRAAPILLALGDRQTARLASRRLQQVLTSDLRVHGGRDGQKALVEVIFGVVGETPGAAVIEGSSHQEIASGGEGGIEAENINSREKCLT